MVFQANVASYFLFSLVSALHAFYIFTISVVDEKPSDIRSL